MKPLAEGARWRFGCVASGKSSNSPTSLSFPLLRGAPGSSRAQLTPRHLHASKAWVFTGQYGCWASVLSAAGLSDSTSITASLTLVFASSGLSLCSGASTASACPWVTVPRRSTAAGAPGARGLPAHAAAARACRARSGSAAAPRKRPLAPPELVQIPFRRGTQCSLIAP